MKHLVSDVSCGDTVDETSCFRCLRCFRCFTNREMFQMFHRCFRCFTEMFHAWNIYETSPWNIWNMHCNMHLTCMKQWLKHEDVSSRLLLILFSKILAPLVNVRDFREWHRLIRAFWILENASLRQVNLSLDVNRKQNLMSTWSILLQIWMSTCCILL